MRQTCEYVWAVGECDRPENPAGPGGSLRQRPESKGVRSATAAPPPIVAQPFECPQMSHGPQATGIGPPRSKWHRPRRRGDRPSDVTAECHMAPVRTVLGAKMVRLCTSDRKSTR